MSWIKLPRSILKAPVFKDPRQLKVWLWCLLKAAHRPTIVNMYLYNKTEAVELAAGEFIFSRQKGATELGIPVTTFGRELKKLEAMGYIKVKPRHRYYSILQLKIDVPVSKAKPKTEAQKNVETAYEQLLTTTETEKAIKELQKEYLPKLMSDLYIYSHPDTILLGYQSYLQRRPQQFASVHEVQRHMQQYLLLEWV